MTFDHPEKNPSSAIRLMATLLPISNGRYIEAKAKGKFFLTQTELPSNRRHINMSRHSVESENRATQREQ